MRTLAIIISPLIGCCSVWLLELICSHQENINQWEDLSLLWFMGFFYQLIIELLLISSKKSEQVELSQYYSIIVGSIIFMSIMVGVGNESIEITHNALLYFFIYFLTNTITYNYLYFSKVVKQ